jgi:hypothetical protein
MRNEGGRDKAGVIKARVADKLEFENDMTPQLHTPTVGMEHRSVRQHHPHRRFISLIVSNVSRRDAMRLRCSGIASVQWY